MQFITILRILQEFYLIEVFKTLSRLRHVQLLIWRPGGAAHHRLFQLNLKLQAPTLARTTSNQKKHFTLSKTWNSNYSKIKRKYPREVSTIIFFKSKMSMVSDEQLSFPLDRLLLTYLEEIFVFQRNVA